MVLAIFNKICDKYQVIFAIKIEIKFLSALCITTQSDDSIPRLTFS